MCLAVTLPVYASDEASPSCSIESIGVNSPEPGTVFEYRGEYSGEPLSGALFIRILDTQGGRTRFQSRYESFSLSDETDISSLNFGINEVMVSGVLPGFDARRPVLGDFRRVLFPEGDPHQIIDDLSEGEEVLIPSIEESRFDGHYRRINFSARIRNLGCENVELAVGAYPVINFEVETTLRRYRSAADDGASENLGVMQFAPSLGWWVVSRGRGEELRLHAIHTP